MELRFVHLARLVLSCRLHDQCVQAPLQHQQRRADNGNEFIHFSIRAIITAQGAKRRGRRVMSLLEHPEDLGRVPRGVPASIWQLPELRAAFGEFDFVTVAGYQCQFEGVDRPKPTRLLSDILSLEALVTRAGRSLT